MGNVSALTAISGQPHGHLRPLREALLHRLGIKESAQYLYPDWDITEQHIIWRFETFEASAEHAPLLDDAFKAFDYFYPETNANRLSPAAELQQVTTNVWRQHVLCLRVAVYALCSEGSNS